MRVSRRPAPDDYDSPSDGEDEDPDDDQPPEDLLEEGEDDDEEDDRYRRKKRTGGRPEDPNDPTMTTPTGVVVESPQLEREKNTRRNLRT